MELGLGLGWHLVRGGGGMRVGARVGARVWVGVRAGARVRCGAGGPQARRGGGLVQAALAPLEQRHEQRLVPRAGVGRRLLQGVDVLDGAHQHDGAHGDDGVGRRDDQVAHAEALVSAGVGSRCRVVGAWAEGWWSAGECRLVRPCLLWVLAVGGCCGGWLWGSSRILRALLKATRPRGVVSYRLRQLL